MWRYEVWNGVLSRDGVLVAFGYSGADTDNRDDPDDAKNDPSRERERNVGPVPRGKWHINPPFTHPHAGPYTMRLTPTEGTQTFGRDGFLIHGDSRSAPGTASKGCIILSRVDRVKVWESGDHELEVV